MMSEQVADRAISRDQVELIELCSPERLLNRFHVAFKFLLQGTSPTLVLFFHSGHRGYLIDRGLIVCLIGHLDLITDQRCTENSLPDLVVTSHLLILFLLLLVPQTVRHLC